jgi:hypothetical protein
MKILMTLVLTAGFASLSWARTSYETGRGQQVSSCFFPQGSFCISGIKAASEAEARRQADWSCQMKHGTSRSYTASCNTTCFPNLILPGQQNTSVRCSSACTVLCEIQD